jgi:putative DNA primase/helicase
VKNENNMETHIEDFNSGPGASSLDDLSKSYFVGETQNEQPTKKQLVDYVQDVKDAVFGGYLIYANETFYTYRDGYWPALNERVDVRKATALHLGPKATPSLIGTYLSMMQDLYAERGLEPPGNLICLTNGTLDPLTGILVPHCPNHRLRTKLDIQWDIAVGCSRWIQFLDEIFRDDPDRAEKIACLQEWFGYCLTQDVSFHKFMWLLGNGGNGKSTVLEVLESLVGSDNVSHAHLGRLEDPTARAQLDGKLVNLSGELGGAASIGEHFKSIVSGEPIEGKRLFKDPYSFRPFARLMASTNDLPILKDGSRGFERRAIILKFNRDFAGTEEDKNLVPKLISERAGIFRWSVEGVQRLKRNQQFTIPPSSVVELARYRKEADSVQLFVDDMMQASCAGGMEPSRLYSDYATWCKESGHTAVNKLNFGKRLSRMGIAKRKSNGRELWMLDSKATHPGTTSASPPGQPVVPIRARYQP